MKSAIAAILAVTLLALTGCGAGGPRDLPAGLTATAADQGVEVTASVGDAAFRPGAIPAVQIIVRNKGKAPVRYIRYNGCDPGFHVSMVQGEIQTGYFLEKTEGEPRGCTDAIEFGDLQPGATLKATYVYAAVPDMPPPSNGEHLIRVSFNRAQSIDDLRPVVAALKVTVEGGEARVTQAEALSTAKADPRVAQWLKAHPEVPVINARWKEGRWVVLFATKSGPTPREVEVAVRGVPAKVESVTWR